MSSPLSPPSLLLLLLCTAPACAFDGSGVGDGDGGPTDGDPDADVNAPDADPTAPDASGCESWPAVNISPCNGALPAPAALTLAGGRHRYSTTSGLLTGPGGDTSTPPSIIHAQNAGAPVRALVLSSLVISGDAELFVEGDRALLVVVHGDATVDGTIDVSAGRDELTKLGIPGPGANDAACAAATIVDGEASSGNGGGGGGGGGGYGEDGADGGDGQGMGHGGKGAKGPKNGGDTIEPLRGGCAGGVGGDDSDDQADGGGAAGQGGGALEITARGTITIAGTLAAGAVGGTAAQLVRGGGGGGGSGGAILLDGDVVVVTATASLCANGAGGGEGGQLGLLPSQDGSDSLCSSTRAPGGALELSGGNGGSGGAGGGGGRKGTAGTNGATEAGGGGGGGSSGRIRARGRTTRTLDDAALVSPPATP